MMAILMLNWYAMLSTMDDAFAIAGRIVMNFERTGRLILINLTPIWLPELTASRRDPRFPARPSADAGRFRLLRATTAE